MQLLKLQDLHAAEEKLREQSDELTASRHELERERSRYRELFDSAPIAYVLTSPQGVIQQVNQAAADLLSEDKLQLQGVPLAELLSIEDRRIFFETIARLKRGDGDQISKWEAIIMPKNRAPFPAALALNLVLDDDGRLSGLRWVVRDVTEHRQAEERAVRMQAELEQRVRERTCALEAANRELEAFSYSVSHDLRAPLRSVNGFVKALIEDYSDALDAEGLKYLFYARDAGGRMSRIIDDLMGLSRATRGELHRQEVNLSDMAEEIIGELQQREPQRAVEVKIAPAMVAHGDEGLLRIALENLLGNAWKFTSRRNRSRIEFQPGERNGSKLFIIRDNGAGFTMSRADKLFGMLQRLHSQDEFPGTGIGLATVRRIITRHGGEIWAEGKANEGATFYFTLPEDPG
jgi:PAS domain S-box-containing protein